MTAAQTPTQRERERERESKNGANAQNLASQTPNLQNPNSTNSAQNSQNSVNLMPNSAENSQISQNLNQNSKNDNFANAKFIHSQTAGTRTGALTDTQNLANSQRQNARAAQDTEQTTQNPTNQSENSQFSTPTNTPKNSLESYKKLDYSTLSNDEKSEGYIFHILTDKISESTRQKLEKLAQNLSEIYPCEILVHICNDAIFQGLPKWGANYLAYFRFFIPNFMPRDLKMCLYLDTDMFVVQDLRELFTLNLQDKIVVAVKGVIESALYSHKLAGTGLAKFFDKDYYFNSGFLLINLQEWQKEQIVKQCYDFASQNAQKLLYPDQDMLNIVVAKRVLILPFSYNLICLMYEKCELKPNYSDKEMEFALQNPVIYHFAGVKKPWDYYDINKIHYESWWKIAFETPCFADELRGVLANLQAGCGGGESEFERLKRLEHFGGFVRFYTRKQLAKIRRFFAKIRRKTRFIRYPIKRFFGFGGEKA